MNIKDSDFSVLAEAAGSDCNCLLAWLTEIRTQRWPILNEVEMAEISSYHIEKAIPRHRK